MTPTNGKIESRIGWGIVLILFAGCVLIMRPFISALLWGIILCFASWPIYQRLVRWLGNRRSLAAFLMTLAIILIVLTPVLVVGASLADNVRDFTAAARRWVENGPPPPPAWLPQLPVIGQSSAHEWQALAQDTATFWKSAQRFIEPITSFLLTVGFGFARGLIQLALSIFIAFFLFRDGSAAAGRVSAAVERIGGERGRHLLDVACNTVRGVVYGILGTSLLQAIMAGVGYWIAGVPDASLLALLTFFASIIPILGIGIVWIPASIWLLYHGSIGWGIFLIVWGMLVSSLDNFVRPWLISHGSSMPFLLVFFGVVGGAIAFGFVGVFLGPTLLAVAFRLIDEWNREPAS